MIPKLILHSLFFTAFLALLLFWPAGTLAWPQGWLFILLFVGCSEAMGVWLWQTNPSLLAVRMESPLSAKQQLADRAIIVCIMAAFVLWIPCMALDARRFEWSHAPGWMEVAGGLLIVAAFYGWAGVLKANSFASTTIRLQQERGQTVISSGPYAIVRHPMYAYALLLLVGMPLLLGSLWGLLALPLFVLLLTARTIREEAMLRTGLHGYGDYAAKVRYRFLPGVW